MITLIKILTWLASPIGILCACSLVAAALLGIRKAPHARLLLVTIGIGQLLLFAWPPVATQLSQHLEYKALTLQAQNTGGPYAAILLLGGGMEPALPGTQSPANAHEAFDRVIYAAQLYHHRLAPRIIVSGGTGLRDTYPQAQTEAAAMKTALILMGVPAQAILTEDQSLNTRQNMAFTADLLKTRHIDGTLAVITSATHMPRAIATANKTGLQADAYPTDWVTPWPYRPLAQRWLPNAQALEESERSLKEWIALLASY